MEQPLEKDSSNPYPNLVLDVFYTKVCITFRMKTQMFVSASSSQKPRRMIGVLGLNPFYKSGD